MNTPRRWSRKTETEQRLNLVALGTERTFSTLSGAIHLNFWPRIESAVAAQFDIDPEEVDLIEVPEGHPEYECEEVLCARGWPLARIEKVRI
jgi:hypothetical protein